MQPLFIPLAFLLGSIPTGLLLARARGVDIRAAGSGNIGATNVGRVLGRRLGAVCLVLDLLKGLAPTLAYGLVFGLAGRFEIEPGPALFWLAVAAAAILGHVFSPWLGFRGGKGVATGLGAMLGVFPVLTIAAAVGAVVWVAAVARWRYVSLGSLLAAAAIPPAIMIEFGLFALRTGRPVHEGLTISSPFVLVTLGLALLLVWAHRANIARLRAGVEHRVGMTHSGAKTPDSPLNEPRAR